MMREVPINYVMILVSGVVYMAIGLVWYSTFLFEKQWMKLSGMTKEKMEKGKKDLPKTMITSFITALIMAYCLRYSVVYGGAYTGLSGVPLGLMTGFFTWLGFMMPVQLMDVLFEKRPFPLFLINTGYQLVVVLAMGVVLSL